MKEESQDLLADVIGAFNVILTAVPNYAIGVLGPEEVERKTFAMSRRTDIDDRQA